MSTKLSVNINKIATLRNSRGGNYPNLIQLAKDIELFGAEGITVHPRPDERHIKFSDVYDLKEIVTTELNIEGNPNEKFIQLIEAIKPQQTTLVPDADHVLTSNQGWDIEANYNFLEKIINRLKKTDTRVSVFINPDVKQVEWAKKVGADRIEIYTGNYAHLFEMMLLNNQGKINYQEAFNIVEPYQLVAKKAHEISIGVNAGHDLNLDNLTFFNAHIKPLHEVSIGHALIADSLYFGLQNTVAMYKRCLH